MKNSMKLFGLVLTLVFVVTTFSITTVYAQSSGSFSASFERTQCSIANNDGTLSGGIAGTSLPDVTVKVSGGNGVALVITPSLVTGLYTKNKLSSTSTTSTQNVGLRVKVLVDGSTANVVPEVGSDGVIYDQRFIQVIASFLSGLLTCSGDCFTIVQSTLSAHSFNFYVSDLAPGTHTIRVSWDLVGGGSGEGTCVGPGTLAVQQVKNFSFNSGIGL
ncbi:MAG: hypothetical protein E6K63_06520 [Nitrospirae bacterium]|nr:MAG: hypothetical protein E6K63_06520 [Nitrospirota bacterium]